MEYKIFLICREWEQHLSDFHARERNFGWDWDEQRLKELFIEIYDTLHSVKMTDRTMTKLQVLYQGAGIPPEDLKMYENELNIEIEVVKDVSERVYYKISGSEL